MKPAHAKMILEIQSMLSAPDGKEFATSLMSLFAEYTSRGGQDILRDLCSTVDPILEAQKTIGYATALIDISQKSLRISRAYFAELKAFPESPSTVEAIVITQKHALGDAFFRFGEKLMELAKVKGAPVMAEASEVRANRARSN